MVIHYKKDMKKNYMVIEAEDSLQDEYCIRMIQRNKISGILPMEERRIDQKIFYYYDISGKQCLDILWSKVKLDFQSIYGVITDITRTLFYSYDYLLHVDSFAITPNTIFYDLTKKEYNLAYILHYKKNIKEQICDFIEYLMNMVDYEDKDAVYFIYQIHGIAKRDEFTLKDIANLLAKMGANLSDNSKTMEDDPFHINELKNTLETRRALESKNTLETRRVLESTNTLESKRALESKDTLESKRALASKDILEVKNSMEPDNKVYGQNKGGPQHFNIKAGKNITYGEGASESKGTVERKKILDRKPISEHKERLEGRVRDPYRVYQKGKGVVQDEREVMRYPITTYLLTGLTAILSILLIIIVLRSGVLLNEMKTGMDRGKMAGFVLILICFIAYAMRRLWDKGQRVTHYQTISSDLIDNSSTITMEAKALEHDFIKQESFLKQASIKQGFLKQDCIKRESTKQEPTIQEPTIPESIKHESIQQEPINYETMNPLGCEANHLLYVEESEEEELSHPTVLLSEEHRESRPKLVPLDRLCEPMVLSYFPFIVGKHNKHVDYLLDFEVISRYHAKITKDGERYFISDLNSTNGTFKNDMALPIYEPQELCDGDIVSFANLSYQVHI